MTIIFLAEFTILIPSRTPAESNLQTTTVECQCDDVGYYNVIQCITM